MFLVPPSKITGKPAQKPQILAHGSFGRYQPQLAMVSGPLPADAPAPLLDARR